MADSQDFFIGFLQNVLKFPKLFIYKSFRTCLVKIDHRLYCMLWFEVTFGHEVFVKKKKS